MTEKMTNHTPAPQHSPWHSPVPYLFGGLAAMLGLIAFALLILACSYWKLSGYLENNEGQSSGEPDLEAGEGKNDDDSKKAQPVLQEKFLVIMAGEVKPTFLATPVSSSASTSRSSSFGESNKSCCSEQSEKLEDEKEKEKEKESSSAVELQRRNSNATHDSSDQTSSSQ